MPIFPHLSFVDESTQDYLHYLLDNAIQARASDIHLEPLRDAFRIRFRVDGYLYEADRLPPSLKASLLSYLKIRSHMDITQSRLPQDGRFGYAYKGRHLDIRCSVIPTLFGESMALRLLHKDQACVYFAELGFLEDHDQQLKALMHQSGGMLLFCGPTGSGKTTTLYSMLNYLHDGKHKIITLEDPIEYTLEGIHQLSIRPTIGLSFAQSLRAILRQAPDLIMLGEIRDADTLDTAIHAAISGHQVLSTLHTDTTLGALMRLMDMGLPSFLIGTAIKGIVAQRLVCCVCPHCVESAPPPVLQGVEDTPLKIHPSLATLLADEPLRFRQAKGCAVCRHTGLLGRIGAFELLPLKPELLELIDQKRPLADLQAYLKAHKIRTLGDDAILKAQRGIIPLSEALALVGSPG